MVLKSFIKKIKLLNDYVEDFSNAEITVYNRYSVNEDYDAINELKKILNSSIKHTENQRQKFALEIILTLILHKNDNIKVSALDKIYFLIEDEYIKNLIFNGLKNMSRNKNMEITKSAQYSLDSIASDFIKLEIFEILLDLLDGLRSIIKSKADKFVLSVITSYYTHRNLTDLSKDNYMNKISLNGFNEVLRIFIVFNRRIDRKFPYFQKIENIIDENLNENEIIPKNNTSKLELNNEDAVQNLANLYARTFMEKGHLRRLIALLNNEDENVGIIGFNALMEVLKVLLTDYTNKTFINTISNSHLDKSLQVSDSLS